LNVSYLLLACKSLNCLNNLVGTTNARKEAWDIPAENVLKIIPKAQTAFAVFVNRQVQKL
jgi:hypothetical protein